MLVHIFTSETCIGMCPTRSHSEIECEENVVTCHNESKALYSGSTTVSRESLIAGSSFDIGCDRHSDLEDTSVEVMGVKDIREQCFQHDRELSRQHSANSEGLNTISIPIMQSGIADKRVVLKEKHTFFDKGTRWRNFIRTNKWVLLMFYIFYIWIFGPSYLNWAPMRELIFWGGAFHWECDPNETSTNSLSYINPDIGVCLAQKLEVSSLFTISTTVDFGCSFLGGLLLDIGGPKVTCLVGSSAMALGWLLLSLSSKSFNAYKVSMCIYGAGVDAAFFGTMSVAYLFPRNENTVLAILTGVRCLSYVNPLILNYLVNPRITGLPFRPVMLLFFAVMVSAIVVAALFVPSKPWKKDLSLFDSTNDGEKEISEGKHNAIHSSQHTEFNTVHVVSEKQRNEDDNFSNNHHSKSYMDSFKRICALLRIVEEAKRFKKDILPQPLFLILPPYLTINLLRGIYFSDASDELLSRTIKFFHIMMAFVFLVPPVFGMLSDKFESIYLLFLVNTIGTLIIICALVSWMHSLLVFEYLSVIFCFLFMPLMTNSIYIFVSDVFPQKHIGKILGLTCTIAGIISLSVHAMFEFSITHKAGFIIMLGILIGLSAISYFLLIIAFSVMLKKTIFQRQ